MPQATHIFFGSLTKKMLSVRWSTSGVSNHTDTSVCDSNRWTWQTSQGRPLRQFTAL